MSKGHECDTELDSPLQFRFRRINEIEVVFFFFFAEVSDTEKTGKTFSKYITALNYSDKTLLA